MTWAALLVKYWRSFESYARSYDHHQWPCMGAFNQRSGKSHRARVESPATRKLAISWLRSEWPTTHSEAFRDRTNGSLVLSVRLACSSGFLHWRAPVA